MMVAVRPRSERKELLEQPQVRLLAWAWLHMRDKFFEFRPAATDPGELPTEDRHRPRDPNSCALESLAQPAQSRHAAARRPWSMHTQDERCSPVEPDVQVETAADVLPRPGRRDLIEQRGDRGVIGAGPWPEPAGQWWRWCQSLGPSSRSFAGSIPPAGRNSMPGTLMFCVSAFKNRQPRILARPPLRSRVAIGGRGHAPHPDAMEVVRANLPDQYKRCQPNLQQHPSEFQNMRFSAVSGGKRESKKTSR